ncbi:hypothetical protein [Pseudomonas fluorescens]|uniref:Uncharacterized protein n=1 Tax=Pseudomonas fluorescens TaxID=294 RepID=A0A5E7B1J8_PSEFL|nr:hypothetical protein [Pseudomonas fluorescens]VVN84510.1 hypothetical protein PS723_01361 [Pseudomonas fluorescens]
MASKLLTSAKHGAYIALAVYAVLILVVTLSGHIQHSIEPPIHVAHPGIQFEYRVQSISAEQARAEAVAAL